MEKNNISLHCNDCHKTTNQVILYTIEKKEQFDEDGQEVTKTIIHNLVQCRGCDFIALQNINTYFREIDGEEIITEHSFIFPEEEEEYDEDRFLSYKEPELLPKTIKKIYGEITEVIDSYSRVLAGVGLRILVEAICLNRKIGKIDKLHLEGFISSNELPILHKLCEIGNLSAHQIKSPSFTVLEIALEIINHLLRSVYIIPKRSKKIK